MSFRLREFALSLLDKNEQALVCEMNAEDYIILKAITINEYPVTFPKEFLIGMNLFSFLSGATEQAREDIKNSLKSNKPIENSYEYKSKPEYSGIRYVRLYPCSDRIVIIHKKKPFLTELTDEYEC